MRTFTWVYRVAGTISVLVAAMAGSSVAPKADDVADFYRGKSLTLMVGANPGGGYDLAARVLARHIGEHLPGRPTVIVQNMQGAGSVRLINWLYSVAPKDGSVFGTFQISAVMEPLFGRSASKFEPRRFSWVGNMEEIVSICVARDAAGIDSFDRLFEKQVVFGGSGPSSNISQQTATLKNLLGARIKIVEGYTGTTGIQIAMQRGEVDGLCGVSLSAVGMQQMDDVATGKIKIILQMGPQEMPSLAGVPHVYKFAKSDDDRAVIDLVFGRSRLGRPLAAPPDIPEARLQALRAAFLATVKQPAFLTDMAAIKLDASPMSGNEVAQQIEQFFSYRPEIIEKSRNVMFDTK